MRSTLHGEKFSFGWMLAIGLLAVCISLTVLCMTDQWAIAWCCHGIGIMMIGIWVSCRFSLPTDPEILLFFDRR